MRNITKAHRDALTSLADLSHMQYVVDQRRPPPNRYPCRKSPSTPVWSPPAVLLQGEGRRPQLYSDVDGERHHVGLDLVDLLPVKGVSNYFSCPPSGTSGAAGRSGCHGSRGMSYVVTICPLLLHPRGLSLEPPNAGRHHGEDGLAAAQCA
jgi:hypothetical protein